MSQVTQLDENEIAARTNRLSRLAASVKELKEAKENTEEKREKREQKNQAFTEVQSAIKDVESTFHVLQRAVNLADVLDASVPHHDIENTLDEYRPQLRTFNSRTYDDFEDVSEISSVRKKFEAFADALNDHKDTVQSNLTSAAADELDDVGTRETILRIPDIGTQSDSDAVQTYKRKLQSVNRGQIIEATELTDAQQRYSEVDIDIEMIRTNYDLSKDAGDLLLRFLQNEIVTLADVDEGVLDELKTLEEFSERLTIQF